MRNSLSLSTVLIALAASTPSFSQEVVSKQDTPKNDPRPIIDLITVVGEFAEQRVLTGSATRIDEETLEQFKYEDIQRILRLSPGVNIQEEDGFGLRPNIGLRGTGVERSSKITLMEDGVLIAPAPYAAPSAYYFPIVGRMQAVEVRKGSSAIKFGPRTVGGAINLVSRDIPEELSGFVDFKYGSDDTKTLHAMAGTSGDNFGIMGEWFGGKSDGFKTLPDGQNTGYAISDWVIKARINTDVTAPIYQSLDLKVGHTVNNSDETYLGVTASDFANSPYDRYAASALDRMESNHDQITLTHKLETGGFQMMTVAYKNDFARDWFKLDKISVAGDSVSLSTALSNPSLYSDAIAILRGTMDSDVGALALKHNNRMYQSKGVQSNISYSFNTGRVEHNIEASVRYHSDFEDRLQNSEYYTMAGGVLTHASTAPLGTGGNRVSRADAWAAFLQDEIFIGNLTLVPGVRFESINLVREDYASGDATRAGGITSLKEDTIKVVTPGLGISYQVSDALMLTTGIFKGFNPAGPGDTGAMEETSVNVEFGAIYDRDSTHFEIMGFYSDYDNILGSCTNAIGCTTLNIGDQTNGGAAIIYGLEVSGQKTFPFTGNVHLNLNANYTYTNAQFKTTFEDSFWGDVSANDRMPYLPAHQFNMHVALSSDRWNFGVLMAMQSATRTNAGQGIIPQAEKIAGRTVFDLKGSYTVSKAVQMYASIDNLFDNTYVVAHRPFGLRPGKPRSINMGIKYTF